MFESIIECNCNECLKRNPVFNVLTDEQLTSLSKNRFTAKYKEGETIFKQGTIITHILSLTSGLVKVYIEGLNEKSLILRIGQAGDLLGGPGLFTDKRFHYSVAALTECTGCFIDIEVLISMVKENKDFAINMLTHVNKAAINNFNKFIGLTQKQMQGRIADALLYLSQNVYKSNKFSADISRQDLADITAMTKESAIRILKEFKDDQIIRVDNNDFEILKPEKLEFISMTG